MKKLQLNFLKRNTMLYETAVTVVASALRAVGMQLFLLPNQIIVGGIMGAAALIEVSMGATHWLFQASIWLVLLNLPLLILSALRLNKKVTTLTILNIVLTAFFMFLIKWFNLAEILGTALGGGAAGAIDIGSKKVLYTLLGGATSGLALPLMLSIHGSNGGTDIVALLVKKFNDTHLMRTIMLLGAAVPLIGAIILLDFNILVYSIVAIFCQQIVEEMVFRGYSAAIVMEITTEKPKEVFAALLAAINRTSTHLRVKGMYTETERSMLICILSRREIAAARRAIRQADSAAFAYVLGAREVLGGGFTNKEQEIEDLTEVPQKAAQRTPKNNK